MKFSYQLHARRAALTLTGLCLLLAAPAAFAGVGVVVEWEAGEAIIPTLGTWSIIALALLLAMVGVRLLRSSPGAGRVVSVLLLAGASGLVFHSAKTIAGANSVPVFGGDCTMGSNKYGAIADETNLENNCSNPIEVTNYIYPERLESCLELVESCPVGTVVPPNGSCRLNYYDPGNCDDD